MDEKGQITVEQIQQEEKNDGIEQSEDELENFLQKKEDTKQEGKLEEWQVITHIFKAFVGPGVLGLPSAVMHGGTIVGPSILVFLGIVCMYNIKLLVSTSKRIRQSLDLDQISYSSITEHLFMAYGEKAAYTAKIVTDFLLCSLQIGFCCVYVVFISHNIQAVVGKLDVRLWMLILLPFLLIIVVKSDIRQLSYFTTTGNIIILISLGVIFQYLFTHLTDVTKLPKFNGFMNACISSGQIVFAFEGIAVILPTENRLKTRESFDFLMYIAGAVITLLYASLGIIGYFTFGQDVLGSITLNVPQTLLFQVLQSCVAVMVFFTYPLQMLVSVEIINTYIVSSELSKKQKWFDETMLRIILVILTCLISISIPQLDNFIALVGALGGTCIALILPPILHTLCYWDYGISYKQLIINFAIIMIGIFACFAGTIATVSSIMDNYINNESATTLHIRE